MSETRQGFLATERGRHWAYGAGLAAAGLLLIVLPAAARLREAVRELRTIRTTYATKLDWVGHKGELERRVGEQEAAVAALDAKLLTAADLAGFTQAVAAAARAVGCSVSSIRPPEPRVLPRPDPKGPEGATGPQKTEGAAQFVEWAARVALQGEYSQVAGLLNRLGAGARFCRVTRLTLQPSGDEREQLSCDLEIAGYGLRPAPAGGK